MGVACGRGGDISKPGSAAAQLHALNLIAMLTEERLLRLCPGFRLRSATIALDYTEQYGKNRIRT